MNVGDRVKFQFGGKEKEGVVSKVFPKKVYLKVDFPRHPGKIVIRPIAELEGKAPEVKKKKKKERRQKEKDKKTKLQGREKKESEEERE